ncbi:ATP-binding cassette domain-containing protein [Chelativorans sp.]|uniref:ATP-binding cassette domain-containing protein n=1 Tax=Chelativorans sp. TaxID=2203393 RepID=UPI00281147D8|nr:ATP-binding cassette domain-containing protein [Chelativorans sp.]
MRVSLRSDSDGAVLARQAEPIVSLSGVTVRYGPTVAVSDLSLAIAPGEILGLVGANGAGKSTLMRVLGGTTIPDQGTLAIGGAAVHLAAYGPKAAQRQGIRTVHQELSLCSNLTIAENFFIEQPEAHPQPVGWRRAYAKAALASIGAVFPGARPDMTAEIGSLPIAQRQMVEIARAVASPGLQLLILDEPTSSLDAVASRQLRDHVRALAARGVAVIFISHKLTEIVDVATRVVAMRNGRKVADCDVSEVSVAGLVEIMGGAQLEAELRRAREHVRDLGPVLATVAGTRAEPLATPISCRAGEIVGIAALEGDGQQALLKDLFHGGRGGASRSAAVAYVSGDRVREGIFPLFDVLTNIAVGRTARRPAFSVVSMEKEREHALPISRSVKLDPERFSSPITELSGGNQQKALVARALATDADILILDDPTRGVDIGTKRQFYEVIRAAAEGGKLVIWFSTEDREFEECDRVLVMSQGRIVRELAREDISEEAILNAAFSARAGATETKAEQGRSAGDWLRLALRHTALIGLVLVFAVMAARNPIVISEFGLKLLLGPAVALVLIGFAQMFVVGGSQIDLGAGAFVGFINVVAVTLLASTPALGAAAILAGLGGYFLLALIIRLCHVPAIVATLGASFIWYGTGYMILPAPGGAAPDWLRALTSWSIPGIPTPLILIVAATAVAIAIHRSRLGTVLRGFGNNEAVVERSGWPALRYTIYRYLIAGGFAASAGLAIAASSGAGDINAGGTYTLLSVAAVVLGGCQLIGGVIFPLGVAAGAVTLSLIGALLGNLGVSTDFNASIQGLLMIAVLGLGAAFLRRDER